MDAAEYRDTALPYTFTECRGIAMGVAGMTLSTHPWVCAREVGTTIEVRNYATKSNMDRWEATDFEFEVHIDQTDGTWSVLP